MIPYPGESLRVYDSWSSVTDDYDLSGDLIYRGPFGGSAGHRVINAGDQWRSWAYGGDFQYLEESGLDLAVSWVVEVLSGTATLAVRDYSDTGFAYDTSLTLPNSLGTLNITGPGTYVIASSLTEADVTGSGALEVSLDCVSGSCDVQQVKLRVWPASGALGGWSPDQDAWDETVAGEVRGGSIGLITDAETGVDKAAAWAALEVSLPVEVAAFDGATHTVGLGLYPVWGDSSGSASMGLSLIGLGEYGASISATSSLTVFRRADPTLMSPLGATPIAYITPPTEVAGDVQAVAQYDTDATATWDANPVPVAITYSTNGLAPSTSPGGGLAVTVTTGPALATTPAGTGFVNADVDVTMSGGAMLTPVSDGVTVSTTLNPGSGSSAECVFIMLNYTGIVSLPDFSGWLTPDAVNSPVGSFAFGADVSEGATYTVHHPAYRVWDPAAVTAYPMRLMQRNDGLGMGSGRVLGSSTRQASVRVLGTY